MTLPHHVYLAVMDAVLERQPACERCGAKATTAVMRDPRGAIERSNFAAVCRPCAERSKADR